MSSPSSSPTSRRSSSSRKQLPPDIRKSNQELDPDNVSKKGQKFLLITAFVIVLFEALVLAMFLGGKSSVASLLPKNLLAERHSGDSYSEIQIGDYDIQSRAFGELPISVKMSVYAKVPANKSERFRQELDKKHRRVDEAIHIVMRTADYVELQEPTLHSLRRRMTLAVQEVMDKNWDHLHELILPDFRTR